MSSARLRKFEPAAFAQERFEDGAASLRGEDPEQNLPVEWPRMAAEGETGTDHGWADVAAPAANDDTPRQSTHSSPHVTPVEPENSRRQVAGTGRWVATSLLSAILHVAVAGMLLAAGADLVMIAGGGEPDLARIGNAAEDSKAGSIPPSVELDVTFDRTEPTAVASPNATEMPPLAVAASALSQTPPPIRIEKVAPEAPHEPDPEVMPEPIAEPARREVVQIAATQVETLSELAPQVKSQRAPQPSHEEMPAASADAEQSMAEVMPEGLDDLPELVEPRALPAALPVPEPAPRGSLEKQPAPEEEQASTRTETHEVKKVEPPARKPEQKRAERKPKRQEPAKSKQAEVAGNAKADARRGEQNGASDRSSANAGRKGVSGPGDAATSNYPGLVLSKLRRALRYPSEASGTGMRGEARVRFTIASNGAASRIVLARSSGFAALDAAALETVRRASPFPAIPAGAGRSNWTFTAPLMFSR